MEGHHSPSLEHERAENRSLRLMADEAEKLVPRFTRPGLAVYRALDNNRIQGEMRITLFGKIMAELGKRKAMRERADQKRRDDNKPGPMRIQPGAYKDAMAHELRQPRDAWDSETEEEIRSDRRAG